MDLLLDTHVLLWWLADEQLSPDVCAAIADPNNEIAVSAASVWEIEIKQAIGKLTVSDDVVASLRENGFEGMPITIDHAAFAGSLPRHHADPFDRMIVAQAMLERYALVTRDRRLAAYGVNIIEA